LDARRKGRPIEPKNLYDGHCHAVYRRGDNAPAADHLRMAGGDRRLEHSVLGELAGRSCGRCSRVLRLHAEAVAQRGRPPVATNRSTMPLRRGGQFENHRAVPWILTSFKEHRSSRMDPILHVSCAPEPDADRIIGDGLSAFNDATVGYADRVPLHVLVSDPDSGKIVGGITGRTSLGLMFIDLVYLPEILRGRDIGARMMALAEEEARRRGCRAGVLYTISFQAPGFYKRLG